MAFNKWFTFSPESWKLLSEFLAVWFLTNVWYFGLAPTTALYFYILFFAGIKWKILMIIYGIHIIFDKSPELGSYGQGANWLRLTKLWNYVAEYFPIKIIKTADLPLNKKYIFACHPHGVLCYSYFSHFETNATNFHDLYPGVKVNLCVLPSNFMSPFYRELALRWGLVSSSAKAIRHLLTMPVPKDKANAIALLVGGAQECMYTQQFKYQIHIKNRKGFIRIAIETGSDIVPVFSFGDTDIFKLPNNEPGTKRRKIQEYMKKKLGFLIMPYEGVGCFPNSGGLLPFRFPINTVFGAPINVEQNKSPTQEEIDKLHEKYMTAIEKIFEEYKWKYVKDPENCKLIMC